MKGGAGRFFRHGDNKTVQLDPPLITGGGQIWDAIKGRRSIRNFERVSIARGEISQLLWASQGITAKIRQSNYRAAPSAGALYPIETLLVVNRAEGIEPGIYHYQTEQHALALVKRGDFGSALARAALNQHFIEEAALVFAWLAVFERSKRVYRERAYQYIFLEGGHIAQNLALAAVALGLGSCQVGAYHDDEVNDLFGLDGIGEKVIYLTPVGKPR